MDSLLMKANDFLRGGKFDYAICGGFALDLFVKRNMREHSDIDICVFEKDKDIIYQFMKDNQWAIYEFQGNGIVRLINSADECQIGRNLMCLKDNCELVKFYPCEKGEKYFLHEFFHTGVKTFNYFEFLFNTSSDNYFIFDGNTNIRRDMKKAILKRESIPFLAPELVLLYKSEVIERDGYQFDFDETIHTMNNEQIGWFNNSLNVLYPNGHKWNQ